MIGPSHCHTLKGQCSAWQCTDAAVGIWVNEENVNLVIEFKVVKLIYSASNFFFSPAGATDILFYKNTKVSQYCAPKYVVDEITSLGSNRYTVSLKWQKIAQLI